MNYNAFSPRVCSLVWEWTERQNKHFRIKISDIPASQFHLQVEIKLESLCRSTGDGKRIVQGKILNMTISSAMLIPQEVINLELGNREKALKIITITLMKM